MTRRRAPTLEQIRWHLEEAMRGLDSFERAAGKPDQRVLDALARCDDGLSTAGLQRWLRIRRPTLVDTLRLMERARMVERGANGRWRIVDGK